MARKAENQILKQIRDVVVEIGFVDGTPMPLISHGVKAVVSHKVTVQHVPKVLVLRIWILRIRILVMLQSLNALSNCMIVSNKRGQTTNVSIL